MHRFGTGGSLLLGRFLVEASTSDLNNSPNDLFKCGVLETSGGLSSDRQCKGVGLQLPKEGAAMQLNPKEPRKEQEPKPEPIDPPSDAPPVELPGDPMDEPNI